MRCAQFRTALSARLDGEPSGLSNARLDKHIARCTGCREWLARAKQLSGHVRAAAAEGPSGEWSARLLAGLEAAAPERASPGRVGAERAGPKAAGAKIAGAKVAEPEEAGRKEAGPVGHATEGPQAAER